MDALHKSLLRKQFIAQRLLEIQAVLPAETSPSTSAIISYVKLLIRSLDTNIDFTE